MSKVVYKAPCGLEIRAEDQGPEVVLCMQTDGPVNDQGYVVRPHPECNRQCLQKQEPEEFYRYENRTLIPIKAWYCRFNRQDQ